MTHVRIVEPTGDGSSTILIPALNVAYHSHHGALQESQHVFIAAGLHFQWQVQPGRGLRILEMGLGTGLNALLTWWEAEKALHSLHYTALELYPLQESEWSLLQFTQHKEEQDRLRQIHQSPWQTDVPLSPQFTLRKEKQDLLQFAGAAPFDLVYYDAFAPRAQPELWTESTFQKLFGLMAPGGVLTTYCAKGVVRRAMQAAGFRVEKIPGPKGKRQMLRCLRH